MNLPDNALVKGLIWFAGIAASISIATAGIQGYADSRYQHRDEAIQLAAASDAQMKLLNVQVEYSADQNQKSAIDRELFRIEQIPTPKLTPADRAFYERLKRERQELVERWMRAGRPLR